MCESRVKLHNSHAPSSFPVSIGDGGSRKCKPGGASSSLLLLMIQGGGRGVVMYADAGVERGRCAGRPIVGRSVVGNKQLRLEKEGGGGGEGWWMKL